MFFVQFCVLLLPLLNLSCLCYVFTISAIYHAHPCMKSSYDISSFLERSLVFPILLFSCVFFHCSLKKAFLSLLAILWSSAFSWVHLSLSPVSFTSLLSSAICKACWDNHLAFLHFFFMGMVLVTDSCKVLWTWIHSSSGTLDVIPWICSSPPLYNHKWFDLDHTW